MKFYFNDLYKSLYMLTAIIISVMRKKLKKNGGEIASTLFTFLFCYNDHF